MSARCKATAASLNFHAAKLSAIAIVVTLIATFLWVAPRECSQPEHPLLSLGCTPQRREYRFPRSLPRTSPYERILSRVRLTIDGSAAVPQPGSNEIDAAPLELKEQPCSSSSADSLAANATLDKENVHRRAGKPKKVPPQTKKQLRTKNT